MPTKITIKQGDNLEILKSYTDNYFDSVVTDAPYGLGNEPDALKLLQDWISFGYHEIKGKGFMGKEWDAFVPQPLFWKEVFRVLKPGGYLLCFFGTRTYDWGTMAIRLAGFEIRDMICWHYGSGFPKSMDVSKAIDKEIGSVRDKVKTPMGITGNKYKKGLGDGRPWMEQAAKNGFHEHDSKNPVSDKAIEFNGYGTAIKPATEPICVARKPIEKGLSVAQNVLKHGTGGINIDGCRIDFESDEDFKSATFGTGTNIIGSNYVGSKLTDGRKNIEANSLGRFPANVILDPFTSAILDDQTGILKSGAVKSTYIAKENQSIAMSGKNYERFMNEIAANEGGASRFFYCAKASQDERNAGCEHLGLTTTTDGRITTIDNAFNRGQTERNNYHPTVKPISLMRYLQRLVTPKGGVCLDPYAGSGTSGCAAAFEDIGEIVLLELMDEYIPIIEARTSYWLKKANREKYIQQLKESQTKLF